MAGRKQKRSVDYFPHLVYSGKTLFTLEKMFKNDGYSALFKTLEILSGSDNHFYDFSSFEDWLYICAKLNLDEDQAESILGMMAKLGFIDQELFDNKILWCQNLVDNFAGVYEKRKSEIPLKPKTGSEIDKTEPETPQSKVNESKGKNKKSTATAEPSVAFQAIAFLKNIGVEKQIAQDWLKVRKAKRAANTETAFNTIRREIEKTGLPVNKIIKICVEESWSGFKASWDISKYTNQQSKSGDTCDSGCLSHPTCKSLGKLKTGQVCGGYSGG